MKAEGKSRELAKASLCPATFAYPLVQKSPWKGCDRRLLSKYLLRLGVLLMLLSLTNLDKQVSKQDISDTL
jgi:hypothetical protein